MYTRCPECQTAFRITVAQLKTRDGLVRCGRCESVFRADLHLFGSANAPAPTREKPEQPQSPVAATERTNTLARDREDHDEISIPLMDDFSFYAPRRHWAITLLLSVAIVVLAALLIGQFIYFYRHELAQLPQLRPALVRACAKLGCELAAVDKSVPEITQTSIAPHPRYANALRIRASLVNRTEQALPLPLMQISLTDSDGKLLARRTFAPHEYLDKATATASMTPNVAVQAVLEVTNPDNKAAGYEVQLFRLPTDVN